ncbi:MAG: porin [Novosphingobium sp.]|nr:porin [Novosphingobium sp.]
MCSSVLALAICGGWALPVHATPATMEAVVEEMRAMRAEMDRMAKRIATLENELNEARAAAARASEEAAAASQAATTAVSAAREARANPEIKVAWKGGPEIEGEGGWSFKPRGRLLFDAGLINAPRSTGRPDGWGNEVRRARLGVEGRMPGGFGYKFEADFAQNEVEILDAFLSYRDKGLTLTIGQHNPFQSLEELTSSNFSSFMERAAFTDTFNFKRRLGLSAQYQTKRLLLQAGLFTDNLDALPNKSWSADSRIVFMPKSGATQLHFGASLHYGELNDAAGTVRYRQRPLLHFTSQRFIDTRAFPAASEMGLGLEAAAIAGPFHAAAEAFWQKVDRPRTTADPTFFGGYAEIGYFLTRGDRRGYRNGMFDRVRPAKPVDEGGIGAIQVNLRYDYLDLNDAGIIGGKQNGIGVSLIWTPTDYTRFMLNYGRMKYTDAVVPAAGGDRSYSVDAIGARAQVDF